MLSAKTPRYVCLRQSAVGRQVKTICLFLPVPFTYTGLVTQYTTVDPWRTEAVLRTGKRDCRGLRKVISRGELAGEKHPRLY